MILPHLVHTLVTTDLPVTPPGGLSDHIMQWAHAVASSHWVLVALCIFCFIDGFFPPFPSETLVIALATWSVREPDIGVVPLWAVFLVAVTGAFLGDLVAYKIGQLIPVQKIRFLNHGKGLMAYQRAEKLLYRRGTLFIFSARFVPVGRVAVNICAGATGFNRHRFIRTDALAVLCWVGYGLLIGTGSATIFSGLHPLVTVAVGVVAGVLMGIIMDHIAQWLLRRFWPEELAEEQLPKRLAENTDKNPPTNPPTKADN